MLCAGDLHIGRDDLSGVMMSGKWHTLAFLQLFTL